MRSFELILLVFAYTILVLTIFVGFLCYKRNLEKWETLALAISLLLLIVALTISPLLERTKAIETTNVFTLLAMVLVGTATPLNVLSERKHKIPKYSKNVLYVIVLILLPLIVVGHFFDFLKYLEYPVIFFLGISVVLSMVLIRVTKPKRIIAHREKVEQIFSITFLILVPISLFANYALAESGTQENGQDVYDSDIYWVSTKSVFRPYPYNTEIEARIGYSEEFEVNFPIDLFKDIDDEVLSYQMAMEDGSELPEWIRFDPHNLSLKGAWKSKAPLTLKVTATDSFGNLGEFKYKL